MGQHMAQDRADRQNGPILGIDLGTTNSVMAVIEGDQPVIIPNSEGGRVTPSVVAFTAQGECLVGQLARRQAVLNAARTITSIKRQMESETPIAIDQQSYSPAQIAAFILEKLKRDAEAYLGAPVSRAVITVPAYFNDKQRQATKRAGELAGLEVVRILNEPTAAALAYGLGKTRREKVLVWDFGGGTFDVSILDVGEGIFEVRATSGDAALGGDDYDRCLVDELATRFQRDHGVDPRHDRQALQRLIEAAERAKIELSSLVQTTVSLPFLVANASGPQHLDYSLTRATFEQLSADLTERTRSPFEQALADARLGVDQINQVVLVGGSTRMPAIQRLVRQLTGRQPNQGVNPDEVVALGAAIQGGVLQGIIHEVLLLDVTPFSLGVEVVGSKMRRLVDRNTPLPFRVRERFTTNYDNQRDVQVHVLQGEGERVAENISLGRFRLDGLAPAPRGTPRIAVAFDIDVNGLVHVSATDEATGQSHSMTVVAQPAAPVLPDVALDPATMSTNILTPRMLTHPRGAHAMVDATPVPPPNAVVRRADALIAQARWVLEHAQPPLSFFEQSAITTALERLVAARQPPGLDDSQLAVACDDLDRLSQHIAQWRAFPP